MCTYPNSEAALIKLLNSKVVRILGTICLALVSMVVVGLLSESYVKHNAPVSPYGYHVFVDLWNTGYIGLQGTWIMENDKPAFPLQVSKITCSAREKSCIESRAEISGNTLIAHQDRYEITHWDERLLIYTDSAQCVDYIYTVIRETKQVSGVRKSKKGMEKDCPDLNKEIKLRLTNGFDVYLQLQREATPRAAIVAAVIAILLWAGFQIRKILKSQPSVS